MGSRPFAGTKPDTNRLSKIRPYLPNLNEIFLYSNSKRAFSEVEIGIHTRVYCYHVNAVHDLQRPLAFINLKEPFDTVGHFTICEYRRVHE